MPEVDAATWKLACRYGGQDPGTPNSISVEVFEEYSDESWALTEFQKLIAVAIVDIPQEYLESARVELKGESLTITYQRLENADEVAANVARALAYARDIQARERADYERLKAKFEGPAETR